MREALVKATLRAIAEDGPEGFTLRDVARRAGVSPAAPYRHFRDKDELFAAVAAECAERLVAVIEAAIAEPSDDALHQFRNIGIALVQFAAANPEHFRALNAPAIADRLPGKLETWNLKQRELLAAGQAAGQIAAFDLDTLLLAANCLVLGLGNLIVQGHLGEVSQARAKQLAIAATAVLGLGLIPR
ncbi:MAG: TetR/AcrR family transcriptional regulator [Kofleriaceae bacterium]